jgi:hypothetical protein
MESGPYRSVYGYPVVFHRSDCGNKRTAQKRLSEVDIWGEYAEERSGSGYIGFAVSHQAYHFLRVLRPAYGYLAEELFLLRLHHLDTEVTAHIK